ncbi:glucose-methanol-choline oxidoreductase [Penicillium chermesinum]|nr:glucose-methanol-choline oxidoreductase [Penicillium chermesinum]
MIQQPQGNPSGSSSEINGQDFIAPSEAVIDAWSKLGAAGWTWDQRRPFSSVERNRIPSTFQTQLLKSISVSDWVDPENRGWSGFLRISFPAIIQEQVLQGLGQGVQRNWVWGD